MNQMIWYVTITELLWCILAGKNLCRKISDDVRGGNIAYNINKPYNYIGYSLANHLGSVVLKMIVYKSDKTFFSYEELLSAISDKTLFSCHKFYYLYHQLLEDTHFQTMF